MEQSFDATSYVVRVGQELVKNFADASFATAPGQVGSAREVPTREKLEQLLPRGIAVGSGFVIDSFGNTSCQMDIVMYEKDICPVFSINRDPETTYYPCEGVIAVGEIKTNISTEDLEDIFNKSASAKKLQRYTRQSPDSASNKLGMQDTYSFRKYGSPLTAAGAKSEEFSQEIKSQDQVFAFGLSGSIGLRPQTICKKYVELLIQLGAQYSPNMIVALDGGVLCPLLMPANRHNPIILDSPMDANCVYFGKSQDGSFQFLLSRLYQIYRSGRTVELTAFDRYFSKDGVVSLQHGGTLLEF